MRPVDRVARLEADDGPPAALVELRARVGGRQPVVEEVVVRRERDRLERAGDAAIARLVERLHARVLEVLGLVHGLRLLRAVALEDLGDAEDRERLAPLGRRERHGARTAETVRAVLVDRQRHGDRPREAVLQVHRLEDRVVVGLPLEPGEGRQRPTASISRSASSRSETTSVGRFRASSRRVSAAAPSARSCTRVPPCGSIVGMVPSFRSSWSVERAYVAVAVRGRGITRAAVGSTQDTGCPAAQPFRGRSGSMAVPTRGPRCSPSFPTTRSRR